jgi:hypothetical protein
MTGPVGVEESGRGYALGGVEGQTEAVGTVGSEREIGATGVGDLTNSSSVVIGVTESSSVGGGGGTFWVNGNFLFLAFGPRARRNRGWFGALARSHYVRQRAGFEFVSGVKDLYLGGMAESANAGGNFII